MDAANDVADCLVLGAGLAALTFVDCRATATTDKIVVLEKGPSPGGIIRPMSLLGTRFDVGPHILFQANRQARDYWTALLPGKVTSLRRHSSLLYRGSLIDSPLRVLHAVRRIGLWTCVRAMTSFMGAALGRKANGNAKEWVQSRYGKVLYEEFFASYNRKLWGLDMGDIDASWPDRRIKRSLPRMIWESITRDPETGVKTFDFADGGASSLVRAISERITKSPNVSVHCSTIPTRIGVEHGRVTSVITKTGAEYRAPRYLISSIPVDELIACIEDETAPRDAARRLRWRSVITVNLVVPKEANKWFTKQWVDVHDERLACIRITNFGRISETMASETHTVLCVEYCCEEGDALWRASDQELVDLAIGDIREAFKRTPETVAASAICRIAKAYPVCAKGFDEDLREIRRYTDKIHNLVLIGRSGTFQYNNMHEAINVGAFVAENLHDDLAPEVWATFHFAMRGNHART